MLSFGLTYYACVLLQFLYPTYASYKAIQSRATDDDTQVRLSHLLFIFTINCSGVFTAAKAGPSSTVTKTYCGLPPDLAVAHLLDCECFLYYGGVSSGVPYQLVSNGERSEVNAPVQAANQLSSWQMQYAHMLPSATCWCREAVQQRAQGGAPCTPTTGYPAWQAHVGASKHMLMPRVMLCTACVASAMQDPPLL